MLEVGLAEPVDIVEEKIKMGVVTDRESQDGIQGLLETLTGLNRAENAFVELLVLGQLHYKLQTR